MKDQDIGPVIRLLRKNLEDLKTPVVTHLSEHNADPFHILISTILSARTKDEVTAAATERLFSMASTPAEMMKLAEEEVVRAIFPAGFYRTKAKALLEVSRDLVERFGSEVPDTIEELLTLRGVGRKTANLVVTLAFNKDGICVDTHVHRISNRLGYIKTRTPAESEQALRKKLPRKYWIIYNTLLVAHGQNICRPVSPLCSRCPVRPYCERVGVIKNR
jgi:endonuclease III